MELKQLETTILNHIFATADFPQTATNQLLKALPPYTAVLPAGIYLLSHKNPTGEHRQYAIALTAFTLSALMHRDVTEQRAFTVKQGILGGDFCMALAFSFLPETLSKEEGLEILKIFCRYQENSLAPDGQSAIPDFSSLLGTLAARTAPSPWTDAEKERYCASVTAIGNLWATAYFNPPAATDKAFACAETANYGHPFTEELAALLKEYKGACH